MWILKVRIFKISTCSKYTDAYFLKSFAEKTDKKLHNNKYSFQRKKTTLFTKLITFKIHMAHLGYIILI